VPPTLPSSPVREVREPEPGSRVSDGSFDVHVRPPTPASVLLEGLLADEHEDRESKSLLDESELDGELGLGEDGLAAHDRDAGHVATGVITKLNIYLMSPQDCPGVEPSYLTRGSGSSRQNAHLFSSDEHGVLRADPARINDRASRPPST
jgi:hypothetical protein